MDARATRPALVLISLVVSVAAFGQSADSAGRGSAEPVDPDEEITVTGINLGIMRARIRLAEEAVYARFNELNSTDDYDIHCRDIVPTGSRIRRRVCEPNFWRDIQAEAGEEMARAFQGRGATPAAMIYAPAQHMGELMTQEMLRLMFENAEFRQALSELGTLVQTLREDGLPTRSSGLVLTEGLLGQGVLPYGAATLVQVQVGRRPWRYNLTQRTFAFGTLDGRIDEIEIRCRGQKERLGYEAGAEWTLPEDWRSCSLRVEAIQGTTFAFYEFE